MSKDYVPWGKPVMDEYEIKQRAQQLATRLYMMGAANQFIQTPYTLLAHDNVSHLSYDLDDATKVKLINKVTAILSQQV